MQFAIAKRSESRTPEARRKRPTEAPARQQQQQGGREGASEREEKRDESEEDYTTEGGRGWAPGSREKQGETGQAAGAAKIISHAASAILAYLRGLVAKENVGAWTQRAKHRTSTRRAAKESRGPGVRREEAPPAYVAPEGGREEEASPSLTPNPTPHRLA
ncbi:hypothetical protein MPTK1_2g11290 [Marchantia polymorpha subsp. ruderalis]|uniref:Uncharacterized protein n=1 Tax=Marchantia polymorpha TaxID=3197 RepID=A0A2R6XCQ3_MARPO|nr:hypothetical protein MARPO_0023s0097 [Marchantia polymorpha]BBN01926.1 hypothetical protein Mp_2g11290 [Marchantia polymorpha subsp. ruderalis]|eukprot:PTQ43789.1 hypothetical protein MARPO_0023s0097 [Marchantia polymorpha]